MDSETVSCWKAPSTSKTHEGTLSVVDPDVSDQIGLFGESDAADAAAEAPLAGCCTSLLKSVIWSWTWLAFNI